MRSTEWYQTEWDRGPLFHTVFGDLLLPKVGGIRVVTAALRAEETIHHPDLCPNVASSRSRNSMIMIRTAQAQPTRPLVKAGLSYFIQCREPPGVPAAR